MIAKFFFSFCININFTWEHDNENNDGASESFYGIFQHTS